MDRTLTGTTALGQSGPGSNDNKGVLYIPQSSRAGALPLDAVLCHAQDTHKHKVFLYSYHIYQPLCSGRI